jgi:hypothetical protein
MHARLHLIIILDRTKYISVSCDLCHINIWSGDPSLFGLSLAEILHAATEKHVHDLNSNKEVPLR